MQVTFEQLPMVVGSMLSKLEVIERTFSQIQFFSTQEERPLSVNEAAEFLGIPKNTLYSLTSRRKIPVHKRGKHLFFFKPELTAWVKEGRQKTVSEIQAEARKGVKHGK